MAKEHTPHVALLNTGGLPFQLGVEQMIRKHAAKWQLVSIHREVPWADGFVDLVAHRAIKGPLSVALVFECKRVGGNTKWTFLTDRAAHQRARCRLDWYNGNAELSLHNDSALFCSEWSFGNPTPEADFCVRTRGELLEVTCRTLIASARDVFDGPELEHYTNLEVIVPIIVTNAQLVVCAIDADKVDLESGEVALEHANCQEVQMVRFRKTLATDRGDAFDSTEQAIDEWSKDRERTVFVARPTAIPALMEGLATFRCLEAAAELPDAYVNPPEPERP